MTNNRLGAYALKPDWTLWVELGLACYGFGTFTLLLQQGYASGAVPMLFYGTAYAAVGLSQLNEWLPRRSMSGLEVGSSKASMVRPATK